MKIVVNSALIPRHLEDSDLVAYLDGELARPELENARAHLESCWRCRSRLSVIENSIENFLQMRQRALPEELPTPGPQVEQFRQRLAHHASVPSSEGVHLRKVLSEWRAQFLESTLALARHRKPALAVVVAGLVLVVTLTNLLHTTVSADTVLLQAQAYELGQQPMAGQVALTSVRVDRIDLGTNTEKYIGNIEVVRDSKSQAVHLTAVSASGKMQRETLQNAEMLAGGFPAALTGSGGFDPPLLHYLAVQHWFPEVSIFEFRKLVAGRGVSQTSGTKRDGTFELHYFFAPHHESRISEALLLIDARNYSPVRVSIFSDDGSSKREYRFTRTSFSFATRSLEFAPLFDAPASTAPSLANRAPRVFAKPVPLSYFNSTASDAEVAAAVAVHRIDACLGEEINIFPMSDGSVLVQGLVDRSDRKETIKRALTAAKAPLRVEIYTPNELRTGAELYDPPAKVSEEGSTTRVQTSSTVTLADLSGQGMPLYKQLFEHFSRRGRPAEDIQREIAAFSNEVVALSRQTLLYAWAVRKLDAEFSVSRASRLSASALAQVEEMRKDHLHWISITSHRQAEMLAQIAVSVSVSVDWTSPVQTVPQNSAEVLRLAEQQNDLIRSLFTISHSPPETKTSLPRLISVLRQIGG